MVACQKEVAYELQVHISFQSRGHVRSRSVTNNKSYIYTSRRSKLTGCMFMRRGHDIIVLWQIKNVISISARLLAAKLDKVMTYDISPRHKKSNHYLIT